MKVLVTGGAGYIGSQTAKALAQAGHEPIALDNLSTGHRWAAQWGPLIEGDLADAELVNRIFSEHRISAVMHFAANALVGESVSNPQKYYWNNVVNTLKLLDAMKATQARYIVFSSSAATYGNPEQALITEDHPQRPVNPYGETKLAMERALHWYGGAYGLKWIALRYFNAAGADVEGKLGEDHDPESHLIPSIIQAMLGARPAVEIFGTDYPTPDGTAVRDFIHVADLAEAHLRALEHLTAGGESGGFNLGTGAGHSVREVITATEKLSGKPIPSVCSPRRAGDPPVLVADAARAQRVLKWRARYSDLETIIRSALNWHESRGHKK